MAIIFNFISMFNYYAAVFKKYAVFSGRARRAEYWYFYLVNVIIWFVLGVLSSTVSNVFGMVSNLYVLVVFIPGLAVNIRRLHDIGKSGWMFLIILIPIIGWIWLLVLSVMDSQAGDNAYGPNPKGLAPRAPAAPTSPVAGQ